MVTSAVTLEHSKYHSELKEDTKRKYDDNLKISGCLKDPYCYLERKNRGKSNIRTPAMH